MLLVATILFIIFQPGVVFTLLPSKVPSKVPSKFLINIFLHGLLYGFLIFLLTRDDKKTRDRKKLLAKLKKEIEENKKKEGFQNPETLAINEYNSGKINGGDVVDKNTTNNVYVDYDENFRQLEKLFLEKIKDDDYRKSLKKDDPVFKYGFTKAWNVINPPQVQSQPFIDYKAETLKEGFHTEISKRIGLSKDKKEGFQSQSSTPFFTIPSVNAKQSGQTQVEADNSKTYFYDDGTYVNKKITTDNRVFKVSGRVNGDNKEPIIKSERDADGKTITTFLKDHYDGTTLYKKDQIIEDLPNGDSEHKNATTDTNPIRSYRPPLSNKAAVGLTFATLAIGMCFANQISCVSGNIINHTGNDCGKSLNDLPNPPSVSPILKLFPITGSASQVPPAQKRLSGNNGNRPLTTATLTNPVDGIRIPTTRFL